MEITNYLQQTLQEGIEESRRKISRLEASLLEVEEDDSQIRFQTTITSGWSDYGEKDTTVTRKGLRNSIREAERKFMQVNNRSDVQGIYEVRTQIGDTMIRIPDKFYQEYKQKTQY